MNKQDFLKKYNIDSDVRRTVVHRDVLLKLDGTVKMEKTDEGYLKGVAPIAKVGVMSYLMADGSILREFVPPETLFNDSSMSSLKMRPMTDTHPSEQKVDSENASYRQVGMTGEQVSHDDTYLYTNMVITDGYTINVIQDGRQELSPGYQVELLFQKGEYNGDEYDAIQSDRQYNHVAVVDDARGGTDIRMQLDNADNFGFEKKVEDKNDNNDSTNKKEYSMKFNVDGIQYDADQQVINHITSLEKTNADSAKAIQTSKDSLDAVTAERDTLKTKVDELEKRDITKEINDGVSERLALEKVAVATLDSKVEIDKLDNRGLKLAIIDSKFPELHKNINDDTSDIYINALLDSVNNIIKKDGNTNLDSQRETTTIKRDGGNKVENSDDARKKMVQDQQESWKPKVN